MEMIVQDRSIKLECENYGILGEWSVVKQTVLIKEKQNKCTISYKEYSNNINHIEKKRTYPLCPWCSGCDCRPCAPLCRG